MFNSVKHFLKLHNLLDNAKIFVVGFSGGYDSMCLLSILHEISLECGFKLVAMHLNHNWRGEEAKTEQENCSAFCLQNNIEFVTETMPADIPKTETVAREYRQSFFKKYYEKYNADGLFLAHTKSDNAETLLYRIAKGTGVNGLCGILECSSLDSCKVYRPLMKFSRQQILQYCKDNNLCPNHDSSNDGIDYARNFIRNEIIPKFENINPNFVNAVDNLSEIAISEQRIINEYLSGLKKEIVCDSYVQTQKYAVLSKDVKNKLIVEFLIDNGFDYDMKKVGEIFDFIENSSNLTSGKTMSLNAEKWLFVSKDKIYTTDKVHSVPCCEELNVNKCGEYCFLNKKFIIEEYNSKIRPEFPNDKELVAYVNLPENFEYTLRTRKEGDVISPIGLAGSMKLKKLFINKGVEKFLRDDIILLCNGKEVLWASGVCLSDKIRVKDFPTHVLRIE